MAQSSPVQGRPVVVGANHRSSSLMIRDRLFVEDAAVPGFLDRLRRCGLSQALVLSTCDRFEVQAFARGGEDTAQRILKAMAEHGHVTPEDLRGQTYVLWDEDAVRHIFRVTASLDSMMIGEPQVLGQVKASHRLSRNAGMVGGELDALLRAAYSAAKRVRTETAIGERPVSIAAVATQLAHDLHGDLSQCSALLVGVGEMGGLIAENLLGAGLGHLTVTHPTEARAEVVARALQCHVAPFEGLARLVADADIVLCCLGRRRYVLAADLVKGALSKRRRKPIFFVDAALPGDIEPALDRIDEAFLYDLGDLERVALESRATRESEAAKAADIIAAQVADFMRGQRERTAVPALVRLRQHFESMRERALADAGDDAEKATRLLINRLLHDPSEAMRKFALERERPGGANPGKGEDLERVEQILRRLFRLGNGDGPGDEENDE